MMIMMMMMMIFLSSAAKSLCDAMMTNMLFMRVLQALPGLKERPRPGRPCKQVTQALSNLFSVWHSDMKPCI